MQTNAPAGGEFVDQFNRAVTFQQIQVASTGPFINPINTTGGGGSINTSGVGSIEFGSSGTRTTLTGTATADRTQTLPNESGTIAVFRVTSTNLDFPSIAGNGRATIDVTVASAEVGDAVLAVPTTARTGNFQQILFSGFVSSSNTVTVLAVNTYGTALDLPSLAFKIMVFKGI